MDSLSEIRVGESEEEAKNRIKNHMKPQWDKWEKSLRPLDITELERLYQEDLNSGQYN